MSRPKFSALANGLANNPLARHPPSLLRASALQMASSYPISPDTSDRVTPRSASLSSIGSRNSARSISRFSIRSTSQTSTSRQSFSAPRLTKRNTMSAVDISAIQEAMKLTSLDQHRGYSQDRFAEVKQTQPTEYMEESAAAGYQIIREPHWNKGMLACHGRLRRRGFGPSSCGLCPSALHSPLTRLFRSLLYPRGACRQEPHRPHPPHHGEPRDPEHPCHEDDPEPPDRH